MTTPPQDPMKPMKPAKATIPDAATLAEREARFADEHARFAFHFRCEHCAHVIPSTLKCSMRYPNPDLTGPVRGVQDDGIPTACKYWELSESA